MNETGETGETGGEAREVETASFGAGCFWQVEEELRKLDGVLETAVGYQGGHVENPTYEQVCSGTTGHTEVCRVTYDPARISFADLVARYFEIHDPTQLNRQGPDVGFQYRSVIFAKDDEQATTARRLIEEEQRRHSQRVVTVVEPDAPFWRAEEYHQCYLQKRRESGGVLSSLFGR